ncbi:MAG: hypothetical protein AAF661_15885 [Pseudomonadota bacterium]
MSLTLRISGGVAVLFSMAAFGASTTALAEPAGKADEPFSSIFSGEVSVEVQHDSTYDADDSEAELENTFATIEAGLTAQFTRSFSVRSTLVFEPVLDPEDDVFFEDHGLYAEELFAQYDADWGTLKGGKFNPAFAIGWDAAPGIYGVDFAEDYELTEQIGGGIEIPLALGESEHVLSAAVFFADTTALSDSIIQDRGQLDEEDGGAGNTESLENFTVALDGDVAGTGYSLGFRRLAAGDGDPEDEIGASAALTRAFAVGDGELELLGEGVWLSNAGGGEDDAIYGVFGAAYTIGDWTGSAVYTVRDIENVDTDQLATATIEYDIGHGFGLGLGYKFAEEEGLDSHTVGALATYSLEF